jgi:hypothetical protein
VINSMNPHISSAGATERSPLVEQLARKVDGNRDGEVTSAEFSHFLSSLMQSLDSELTADRGPDPSAPSPAAAAPSAVLLPAAEPGALTRAQGAALLRQAFEPVTRSR